MQSKSYRETSSYNHSDMSLLTLILSGTMDSDSSKMPSVTSRHNILNSDSCTDHDDRTTEPTSVEPPLELDSEESYRREIMKTRSLALPTDCGSRNRIRTYSQCSKTTLGASPLTSCSYKTMSKEYDMDTWRMYNRIQEARSHEIEGFFLSRVDSNGDDGRERNESTDENMCYLKSAHYPTTHLVEWSCGEEIFDLEL
jgi:hypothetical protein